jgi:hypothetical protein
VSQPTITGTGIIQFNNLVPGVVLIQGSGNQVAVLPFVWTMTNIVGQEISRTPEPGTGLLLGGGLAGLAAFSRRLRRRS